jgi:hypothetical protein
MAFNIQSLQHLDIRFKRLAKKFKSLNEELFNLVEILKENPTNGVSLGGDLYKIRLGSESKRGGKSGEFRVITYYLKQTPDGETLYLVTIYDKSEESSVKKDSLIKLVKSI